MLVKSPAFKHAIMAPRQKCRMPRCSGTMTVADRSAWTADIPQKLVDGEEVDNVGIVLTCSRCGTTVHVHALPE